MTESWSFYSENSIDEPCIAGIDEAGRGPVLGPMVYAISYCPVSKSQDLKSKKFADSKILKEDQRDDLFLEIQDTDWIGWGVYCCSPQDISSNMLAKEKYNLNSYAHDTTIQMITKVLQKQVNIVQLYVDTVGPPEKYQEKLKLLFPKIKITVAKKADSIYPIVSAASICAKVTRDAIIREWKFIENKEFNNDFGSGYPSDPKTVKWLQENMDPLFGYPRIVRFSWQTVTTLLEKNGVSVEWEHEQEKENKRKTNRSSIMDMMGLAHVKIL